MKSGALRWPEERQWTKFGALSSHPRLEGGARVLQAGAGGGARPCPRGPFLEARGGSEKRPVQATPWDPRAATTARGAARGSVPALGINPPVLGTKPSALLPSLDTDDPGQGSGALGSFEE